MSVFCFLINPASGQIVADSPPFVPKADSFAAIPVPAAERAVNRPFWPQDVDAAGLFPESVAAALIPTKESHSASPIVPSASPTSETSLPDTGWENGFQTAAYESPYVTREELQQQLQGLAWRKGAFQITPYGRITVSGVYETERTYLSDFALWVESRDVQGESGFYFDAKSTRLGADIVGPSPESRPDIRLGGKVEFDFQGEWVTKNRSGVLFRQAYIEAKNDRWRLLFGQAWDLMSPLYPGMLNYVPGSGVGNLGYRRAQLRLERYFDLSDILLITAQ